MRPPDLGYKHSVSRLAPNDEARVTHAASRPAGCALTTEPEGLPSPVMLQRNAPAHHAHLAHAAVVGMHAICCGLPVLAMLAAAFTGAASAGALLPDSFVVFHRLLHGYELWIVAVSAVLVSVGGFMEFDARRAGHAHGFPWLFTFSCLCFFFNLAVILAHRA